MKLDVLSAILTGHSDFAGWSKYFLDIEPYPYQVDLWKSIMGRDRVLAQTERAVGFSTGLILAMTYIAMYEANKTVIFSSPNAGLSEDHFRNFKSAYRKIESKVPESILPVITTNNRTTLAFDNGTRFHIVNNPTAMRGMRADHIIINDIDSIRDIDELLEQSCIKGGSVTMNYEKLGKLSHLSPSGYDWLKTFKHKVVPKP